MSLFLPVTGSSLLMRLKASSRTFLVFAGLAWAGAAHAQSAPVSALPDLIATEYGFAADAQRHGTKVAFLTAMHDSAIVFVQGQPTGAQAYWKAQPDAQPNDPKLRWAPALAGISWAGDLGYSTGPWQLVSPTGKTVANGQFFTLWQRQKDGTFQWLLDNGVSSPLEKTATPLPTPAQVATGPTGTPLPNKGKKPKSVSPRQLDEQLSTAIGRKGMVIAYQPRLHPQARLLREEKPLFATAETIKKQLAADTPWRLMPLGGRVAASGDVAYSYGRYQTLGGALQGAYVHLWLRGAAGWQLLLEAVSPGPTDAK
jgi:ketosteroid isomerase-like protein